MGTANINWEMTSGGVKIIPKVKQITKKIPRRFFKSFFVATPKEIIVLMMIGIWKPKPKATDSPRTKLKNLEISVEILIESGPIVWKKLNTLGRTIAIQNITPAKNKNVPRADREKTIFFSFLYKPGAINIKSWKIRNGIDISKAKKAVSLKGTRKGEATSIAISSKSKVELIKAAYHLGNRHVDVEIEKDILLTKSDYVIENMLKNFNVDIVSTQKKFFPERGAHSHE